MFSVIAVALILLMAVSGNKEIPLSLSPLV